MPPAADKAALRAASLARRDGLDPAFRDAASRRIADRVLAAAAGFLPGPVSVYWPIRSEVDTIPLMHALHATGYPVALPVVRKPGLAFHAWRPGDRLRRAGFGLSEPEAEAPAVRPVTMLIPLAAFDRHGNRIGYGAGYYDRAIAELSREHPLRAIGLAFAAQEVDRIPVEAHDRVLDGVVTEDGVFGSVVEIA